VPGRHREARREAPDPLAQVGHILTEGSDQNHRDGWNRLVPATRGCPPQLDQTFAHHEPEDR
jgi:hypothetical protein